MSLSSTAIQALRSVLNSFSIVNRKNMFVYQERTTKSVFYLRWVQTSVDMWKSAASLLLSGLTHRLYRLHSLDQSKYCPTSALLTSYNKTFICGTGYFLAIMETNLLCVFPSDCVKPHRPADTLTWMETFICPPGPWGWLEARNLLILKTRWWAPGKHVFMCVCGGGVYRVCSEVKEG